jgi:hypothetical protein
MMVKKHGRFLRVPIKLAEAANSFITYIVTPTVFPETLHSPGAINV